MSTGDAVFETLDYSAANEAVIVQLSGYSTTYARTLLATFSGIEAAIGTAYADALIGNAAGNVLRGGQGADWLVGGAGADRFVYQGYQDWFGQSYEGQDTIADFGDGDVIDIAAIDANWTLSGDQAFAFSTTRHSGVVGEAVVTNYGNGSVITLYFNEDNGVDMTLYVIHASGFGMDAGDFVL
jgi:Ca2+-binding RTX toxin-like protein